MPNRHAIRTNERGGEERRFAADYARERYALSFAPGIECEMLQES